MALENRLEELKSLEGYRQHFMDITIWEDTVRQICARHGLSGGAIRPGLPGTFPAFIVDETCVVKFFGPLFQGNESYRIEKELGSLLNRSDFPAPALLFDGRLEGSSRRWAYIGFEFISGKNVGEVFEQVSSADMQTLAAWLGTHLGKFHRMPVPPSLKQTLDNDYGAYQQRLTNWFTRRRDASDLGLPQHLVHQTGPYLEAASHQYPNETRLHMIHADITRDHILGDFTGRRWQPRALIDFGDCMDGNLYYELSALHLDLFDCNTQMLNVFLDSYGVNCKNEKDFHRRCMAAALQHQFNVFGVVFQRHPELNHIQTLNELADQLWKKGLQE